MAREKKLLLCPHLNQERRQRWLKVLVRVAGEDREASGRVQEWEEDREVQARAGWGAQAQVLQENVCAHNAEHEHLIKEAFHVLNRNVQIAIPRWCVHKGMINEDCICKWKGWHR